MDLPENILPANHLMNSQQIMKEQWILSQYTHTSD